MYDLDQTIRQRRSVRGFLPDRPVPREILLEALELAQTAPSNCNVQPWRVYIASGACCDRVREALCAAVVGGQAPQPEDDLDQFHAEYRRRQVECAATLYGEMGVARDDYEGRARAMARNFAFFDAPHAAFVCMDKQFGLRVALDVGTWLQTFLLALTARGVASCAEASLSMYPAIVRRELDIPEHLRLLCGISFGYEDPSVPANRARPGRQPLPENVVLLDE